MDAFWSEWTSFSNCDQPCNGGNNVRRRTCTPGNYGGIKECPGESEDKILCNAATCPSKNIAWMNLQLKK